MKYSILFMCYDPEGKLAEMTINCVRKMVENAGTDDYEIIVDAEGGGYTKATNRLLHRAKGDYLVFIGNDVFIETKNWLEKLAIPGAMTTWKLSTFHINGERNMDGALICCPREIYAQIGDWDEQFSDGYGYDDNDWYHRAVLLGISFIQIDIKLNHLENMTFKTYSPDGEKERKMQKNRYLFYKKWNLGEDSQYPKQ